MNSNLCNSPLVIDILGIATAFMLGMIFLFGTFIMFSVSIDDYLKRKK